MRPGSVPRGENCRTVAAGEAVAGPQRPPMGCRPAVVLRASDQQASGKVAWNC